VKLRLIAGTVLVVEIATALVLIRWTDRARVQPTDFVNFYVGASIVRSGSGANLYRPETQVATYQSLLGRKSNQYFLHPPFEALALAPLSLLSLERAFILWSLMNVAFLGFLPLILAKCVPWIEARPYAGLLAFCLLPSLTALTLGQDSILLLFVICLSYLLLSQKRDLASGLALSLATIKFQYVVILLLFLMLSRRWRLVAGLGLGCVFLAAVSSWVVGWHGFTDYFKFLRTFDAHSGYGSLHPALMANVRGFAAGMGWPNRFFVYAMEAFLIAVGALAAWANRHRPSDGLMFALFLMIALAASPYAHFSDLTVSFLPIVLALDRLYTAGLQDPSQKVLLFCCVAMFVLPYLLVLLGGHYWWNSRIFLVFPLLVVFILALAAEIDATSCYGKRQMAPRIFC